MYMDTVYTSQAIWVGAFKKKNMDPEFFKNGAVDNF